MKLLQLAVMIAMVGCAGAQQMPPGSEMHGGGAAFLTLTPERAIEVGEADMQRFYAGDDVALWTQMSAAMQAAVKDQSVLKAFTEHMAKYFGKETRVIHQSAVPLPPAAMQYRRIVMYQDADYPMVVSFTFSGSGTIEEFHIKEEPKAADSKYVKYRDRTKLAFPLKGEWMIYQGGPMVSENEHAATTSERFAYDMVMLNGGQLFSHDGMTNEEWFAYGQPVLADANGTVVTLVDDSPDSLPYHPNAQVEHGNVVVIGHGDGEYSVYSHLKHGSIAVKVGDPVKAAEKIAEVGNSGDSQFARLGYNLQTSDDLNHTEGLPAGFDHVKVNGKRRKDAEPVRGDVVERR
ncbi:MAG TPA: M23 family metallopeptidase [Acidobacteriaceae bacterium]|nr:M23 family metallopeptidase [Acidobacteriaceae bacterium]